ncbi:MAG: hypothetical protein DRP10_01410 [Candidatus Aenigmatarchaeota archaeon]|nr:MAG: hypothetical protein DRP10_01410 [Candidatus Aenigmarchaeota archaeon]
MAERIDRYNPREGLNEDLLRVIDEAEKIDGHRLGYLFLNLPDKLTGLYSYPEQTKYSYGLRIPVKKGLNLGESLKKAWKGNIKDESSSTNLRYKVDEKIIVQYAWPRKDVMEILTFDEEDEEKFEDIRKKVVQLSNSLFETLKEDGYIRY